MSSREPLQCGGSGPLRLYTYDEVAATLQISTRWIERAVADGRIPCTRLGRAVRFSEAQIRMIVAQAEEPAVVRHRRPNWFK
jgi:excisionase family DNA binding protein